MYSRVYIEITNVCNMSCSFCHGHNRAKKFMTLDEFQQILTKLEGQTKYIYYHLMGEPLLHPQLPLFLKVAAKKGFHNVITTNGTLLEEKGELLLSSDVYKVNISLHSFEQDNPSAHEAYLKQVVTFADAASKAGVIVVLRLWNNGFDDGRNDGVLRFLRSSLKGEWAKNTKGIRIRKKLHLEWGDRFEWPDKAAPLYSEEVLCYGLRDHFGILCDGSVVPCCLDSDGELTLGNIFSEKIEDILSSAISKSIREGFENRKAVCELCKRCGYAQRFV